MDNVIRYDEQSLLQQLKAGSELAFTELFHHYHGKIYSVALKFLKSPVLAEEIVQDVFLKLWLKRTDISSVERFDAYLFMMARNFIFDRFKKMGYEADMQSAFRKQPYSVNDSEYLVRQHECQRLLHKAISLLPPQQQQVYKLSKIEGLSHERIAEKMQLSKLTVKTHMAKALQFIKKYLNSHFYDLLLIVAICFTK